ncbi:MAG: response regulator [Desulfarculaceae bacterium]|nr:response regulator [Desulfarculaceae bacterium]
MSTNTDLSDQRRDEEPLRQAAREWRQCFDALEELVVVIDRNYRVQRCNKAMSKYLGLDFSQIVGQPCHRLLHGSESPLDLCLQQRMFQQGKAITDDYQDPATGQLFSVTVSPITDAGGSIVGTVHLFKDITEHRRRDQERVQMALELTKGLEATTMALTNMVDSRDPYTSGHSQRVAELTVRVGAQMGLSEDDLSGLKYCGLLHDIGKGAISLDILNKPGKLTEHEMGIIHEHPGTAYSILKNISFPWPVAQVIYQHHERLDGSGYPKGLKGDEIHPWARLLAACDVFEAMTSHRPYRPAHGKKEAFQKLREGAGSKFDAAIVKVALTCLNVDDRRVTVVDDDAGILGMYDNFLRRNNYETLIYNDPFEAVRGFVQSPTPILVTDLQMPGKSGLEVIWEAKRVSPHTEAILITGDGNKEVVIKAMRMGASDFLDKPVKMADLQQAVQRAHERSTNNLNQS